VAQAYDGADAVWTARGTTSAQEQMAEYYTAIAAGLRDGTLTYNSANGATTPSSKDVEMPTLPQVFTADAIAAGHRTVAQNKAAAVLPFDNAVADLTAVAGEVVDLPDNHAFVRLTHYAVPVISV
jgi:hypothetical protein